MTLAPGTHVTVDNFEPGVYTVSGPNPYADRWHPGMLHIWKQDGDGKTFEAWVQPERCHAVE